MIQALVVIALVLGGAFGALVLIGIYIAFYPEKLERIVGWIARFVAAVWRKADKTAVAMRVQGEINTLRTRLHEDGPDMIEKRLRIRWTNAEEAEAMVRGGDVIVFMRDSRRHEENLANAVMAFLPKALIPRARRYVEPDTMRAVDLNVAKALLAVDDRTEGALDSFYEHHMDPARAGSERLKRKVAEIDQIDLHGWLSRVLIAEFRRIGDRLHPADPEDACLKDAEELTDWLFKLANREKDELGSLTFRGRYFSVAIIFVGLRSVLDERGVDPYRRRAKRHIYTDRFDSVYLLARDPNISALDELVESLAGDAMIGSITRHKYRLRRDFAARARIRREWAVCVCLHRRQLAEPSDAAPEDDGASVPVEEYTTPHAVPADSSSGPVSRAAQ